VIFLKEHENGTMKKTLLAISMFITLSLMVLVSCTSTRSIAIEEGWELLGEQKVNFIRDKDQIVVTSRNEFTALRFRVEDRDTRINYLKIYFTSGDILQPAIDEIISAGQSSKIIELAREGRPIEKIEFKYHTIGGNLLEGRANVLVFGKKYYAYGY
jgi:hypothetical protein